jgi:hypothetical protein
VNAFQSCLTLCGWHICSVLLSDATKMAKHFFLGGVSTKNKHAVTPVFEAVGDFEPKCVINLEAFF